MKGTSRFESYQDQAISLPSQYHKLKKKSKLFTATEILFEKRDVLGVCVGAVELTR